MECSEAEIEVCDMAVTQDLHYMNFWPLSLGHCLRAQPQQVYYYKIQK
jgi:hypothetical protein